MKKKIFAGLLTAISTVCMLLPNGALAADSYVVSALGNEYDASLNVGGYGSEGGIMAVSADSHADYTFYLPESGTYKVTTLGTDMNGNAYVSPVEMTINDETVTPNNISGSTTGVTSEVYSTLDAGENTISYKINGTKVGKSDYLMYIDKVTVEYIPDTAAADSITVEGENMSGDGEVVNNADSTYSGKSIRSLYAIPSPAEVTYNISMEEDTEYIFSGFACLVKYSYTSPWTLYVNDTEYFTFGTSAATEGDWTTAYQNIGFKAYSTSVKIPFKAGNNTIKIVVNKRDTDAQAVQAIDYLTFDKVEKTESLAFEGFGLVNNHAAESIATNPYNFSYSFDIPTEISAYLTFNGKADTGANDPSSYFGKLKIQIDDNEPFNATTDVLSYGNPDADGVCDYTTKDPITLTEGTHTIAFICDENGSRANNPWTHLQVNTFEFIPTDSAMTAAELYADSETMIEGENKQLTLKIKDQYGFLVSSSKISGIEWSVDNENVATVSQDGMLTAYNPGTVTVTATVTGVDYSTVEATMTISVYGQNGVTIIDNSVDESGKAVISFTKLPGIGEDTPAEFDVIIGSFNMEGNVPTTFQKASVTSDVSVKAGRIATVEAEGMTGERVRAFVWDSLESMNPVTEAIDMK